MLYKINAIKFQIDDYVEKKINLMNYLKSF